MGMKISGAGIAGAAAALAFLVSGGPLALDPARSLLQYSLQSWGAGEGLPQNSVQALLQSRDGYIWIGTQEGLARFDGVRFTVFDSSNTPAMLRNDVRSLIEARDGVLWAGTYGGGLLRIDGADVRAVSVAEGLAGESVISLARDVSGAVWAGTETGLSRVEAGKVTTYDLVERGLPSNFVTSVCPGGGGELWIGTEEGLCRHDGDRFEAVPIPGLEGGAVLAVSRDPDGEIWVGTRSGFAHGTKGAFRAYTRRDGLPATEVWCFLLDREGNRWLGTSGGLCRFRDGGFEMLGVEEGLSYPVVRTLCEDAEGSLWVGTSSGGLNRLKDGSFVTYGVREGLSADFVWTVCEDRETGGVWIGTDIGGLNRYRAGVFEVFGPESGLDAHEITALCQDREGVLWVGGRDGLFRTEGRRFVAVPPSSGVPPGRVRAVLQTSSGDLWVGTHGGGLGRMNGDRSRIFTTADGLTSNFVRGLHEDRSGRLWVGSSGAGVCRMEGDRFARPEGSEGFEDAYIMCIYEDPEGGMWFGTSGDGLLLHKGGRFTAFGREDGLPDDKIFQVIEDGEGNLWMSCNRGIFRVRRGDLEACAGDRNRTLLATAYSTADGLASAECNGGTQPAGCRTADGRLWFPTIRGVAVVDPRHMHRNALPPPVLVESLRAGGRSIPLEEDLVLPAGTRDLEIRYTALSFLAPDRVLFRYRLEGYDKGWVEAGTRRTAYYTALPPGRYRFRVVGCNNDGLWNEEGAALDFRLASFFYQAWPFRAAAALAFVLAAFGFVRYRVRARVRALKARQDLLQEMVAHRTAELRQANLELERLASIDGLTGLANHRSFHERLEKEWRRCRREKVPLSLVVIDIDHFKRYNDRHGHAEGDACLMRVAEAISGEVHRPSDLAARFGGEEFAVILSGTPAEGALHVARNQRAAVEALAVPHGASPVAPHVTISLGVATVRPWEGQGESELFSRADNALYRAKAGGRNRVEADEPQTGP